MRKYWYKLLNWIGFEVEEISDHKHKDVVLEDTHNTGKPGNIISIHHNKPIKIVLCNPTEYDQVQTIADHLRNSRPVIVNMETLDKNLAKRIMDFLSGTTYAISGSMHKINPNIVLVIPQNFTLINNTENKEHLFRKDYLTLNKTIES
ncbi:MAG: cell division protein SepF [Bacillota bacterium]